MSDDIPTYMAVHNRLFHFAGRASDYVCVCGETAQEWAYDHSDPNELVSDVESSLGRSYSLDLWRYVAMCKSCHKTRDFHKDRCPKGHDLFDDANVLIDRGARCCKRCKYDRNEKRRSEQIKNKDSDPAARAAYDRRIKRQRQYNAERNQVRV